MTLRQKKLALGYLKHGNKTKAAIEAGYSPKTAHVQGSQILEKIKPELNRLMDRMGLSESALLKPIKEAIQANAVYQGIETHAPDHSNRLKSTELAWKLRGHLRPTQDDDRDRQTPILILATGQATIITEPQLQLATNGNGHSHPPQA